MDNQDKILVINHKVIDDVVDVTSVTLDKIEFICQRNNDMEFYKQYFKDKDSAIINNSLHMLSDYADLLSERKGDIS